MKRIQKNGMSDITVEAPPSTQEKNDADNKRRSLYLVGKSLFLLFFVVVAIYGIFYTWSWSISTGKTQAETFTELYFEDNLHLPSQVIPKRPYFFQFTLHNLEGKDMQYPYEVYIEVGQDKLLFDKGTLFVQENGYKTIQERFATTDILRKGEIVVDLVNENQHIDFWIQKSV
jgi:hypothetical protein